MIVYKLVSDGLYTIQFYAKVIRVEWTRGKILYDSNLQSIKS
ncbi:hypothetical protein ACFPFU_06215 [Negadavirga shengliensis]|uniref:Uncharacterized protein n=1 Tax=Negadavirga shengliensis TaxID=1389218 RepID=A0ABV9SY06_9BACT